MEQPLAVREPMKLDEMRNFAGDVAKSKMFGITDPAQAVCLMMICQSEGIDPIMALKRYHLIDGKPSMRADAMQGEFMAHGGAIVWHVRTDDLVAATLFADKAKVDDAARSRAALRFETLWQLDSEVDESERGRLMIEIAKMSRDGEETLIRTYADCEAKGLTLSFKDGKTFTKHNWKASPRQMLTARVITEGVRLINPGLIAGIYTPDEVEDFVRQDAPSSQQALPSVTTRDLASIQKMMEQHLTDIQGAKPERRRELLGLIADLRVQLSDMGIKVTMQTDGQGTPTAAAFDSEPDEIPGISASAARPSPAPIEASGDGEPELITGDPRATQAVPKWPDYILQHVKIPSLRGKRLGDFGAAEIASVWKKMPRNALQNENPQVRDEANYIKEAYEALNPTRDEQNES